MTALTDDRVRALLDDLRKPWTIAENMQPLLPLAADAIEALLQARADAAAAVALMVERAAEQPAQAAFRAKARGPREASILHDAAGDAERAIRRLAPDAGTAELARLRGERDDLRERVRMLSFMGEGYVFLERERDTLAASLAAQTELVETLTGALIVTRDKVLSWAHDTRDGVWSQAMFDEEVAEANAALEAATIASWPPEQQALFKRVMEGRAVAKGIAEGQG